MHRLIGGKNHTKNTNNSKIMCSKINYLAQNKNLIVMGGGKPSTEKNIWHKMHILILIRLKSF